MNCKYLMLFILVAFYGCEDEVKNDRDSSSENGVAVPIYKEVDDSNVNFTNFIEENLSLNIIANIAILHGGGVGVIDVNNDGLQDIYFAGNMVTDKLFLNTGNLKFKDISHSAGIDQDSTWSSGISIVDINNDGYQDVYVCKFIYDNPKLKRNLLYINNKDNTFTEKSAEYGVDDTGYSVMANFFDYDNDGDLDLYVANQPPYTKSLRRKITPTSFEYTDRLYRNDGNTFTDVTVAAGVQNMCYSLSATVSDINNDGFPDIYVACDYEEPDMLYQNNGNGTFTNVSFTAFRHMSNFSMGADIADINNDGHLDIFTADMVAEDNFRNKTNMASMAVDKFWNLVRGGYHFQYMFNALQLNNGNGTFSEVAQLAGVSKTDWSWSSLFVDADHDGNKDLFVTNGILMEIRNKDYMNNLKKIVAERKAASKKPVAFNPLELSKMAPQIKVKNKSFRNTGDLFFENVTDSWGFGKAGWSQGMAYADLDNDGDLDLIVSNTNEEADIFENRINDISENNYIAVQASGFPNNNSATNTRVKITTNSNESLIWDLSPYRGYMSTSQNIAHFGLGKETTVEKLEVIFPDGKIYSRSNVKANQTIDVKYDSGLPSYARERNTKRVFLERKDVPTIVYQENQYDDYATEVLIPYKMSNLGPFISSADVNNDGYDDFFIGGALGQSSKLFIQQSNGSFIEKSQSSFQLDSQYEDSGAHFFDVNGDGHLDLYVASGGNEKPLGSDHYKDRVYLNDGNGSFSKADILPSKLLSTSVVLNFDMDKDGDQDLFIGGRQIPGKYGMNASSYILENKNGNYIEAKTMTEGLLDELGMVTGAIWSDIDGDQSPELVISGEWMPITVFKVVDGKLKKSINNSLSESEGLWNTLKVADLDKDGDQDLIAGNYGMNYKYKASADAPLELYVNDFDTNGSNDVYLGYHDESDGGLYPVRGKQCSSEQMPFVKEKYEDYNSFGKATVIDVLSGRLEGSTTHKAKTIANSIFLNDGSGNFTMKRMPTRAQASPLYDMVIEDFNGDGHVDIFGVGNFYNREIETTRSDAGTGVLLLGDGSGDFVMQNPDEVGVLAVLDARAVKLLKNKNGKSTIAIANNSAQMQFYYLAE